MKASLIKPLLMLIFILSASSLFSQETAGGWDFMYTEDSFSDEAMLDLSYLNENNAGEMIIYIKIQSYEFI
ncbi:MAG: hypothetical protein ACOC1R_02555 [Tangfeifania sp.]